MAHILHDGTVGVECSSAADNKGLGGGGGGAHLRHKMVEPDVVAACVVLRNVAGVEEGTERGSKEKEEDRVKPYNRSTIPSCLSLKSYSCAVCSLWTQNSQVGRG